MFLRWSHWSHAWLWTPSHAQVLGYALILLRVSNFCYSDVNVLTLRGPPGMVRPMVEPMIPRSMAPEGALLVTPMRTARPLLSQMHTGPIMHQPRFMTATSMGMHPMVGHHPSMVHPTLRVEPNLLGGPVPFGVNPPGFRPFNDHVEEAGLPPMSEEEFYRYQKKMKIRYK